MPLIDVVIVGNDSDRYAPCFETFNKLPFPEITLTNVVLCGLDLFLLKLDKPKRLEPYIYIYIYIYKRLGGSRNEIENVVCDVMECLKQK